ncbi:WD40-repeat-containing domain protein [Zopfochytrium polystomum]|nr:WD40-repeat-containing domain protein [Zopfochytrium polystomum]
MSLHVRWRHGTPLERRQSRDVGSIFAVHRDWLLTGPDFNYEGRCDILRRSDGQLLRALNTDDGTVYCAYIDPSDGRTVLTGLTDGTVRLWDATTGACRLVLRANRRRYSIRLVHMSKSRIVAFCEFHAVKLWDRATGDLIREYEGGEVDFNIISAHGDCVAEIGLDGTIQLWNVETDQRRQLVVQSMDLVETLVGALQYDGVYIAVYAPGARAIHVWDSETGALIFELQVGMSTFLTFSISCGLLATLSRRENEASEVEVWDLKSGLKVQHLESEGDQLSNIHMDPRGFVSCTLRATLLMWDFGDGIPHADDF